MRGISCYANFKENLNKNVTNYSLVMPRINGIDDTVNQNIWVGEHAVLSCGTGGNITTKICEGYQFTIAFYGTLSSGDALKNELYGFGYHFLENSDSELALFCYIHFGERCFEKLKGYFSFIIYDAMRRQVFAFSDKSGTHPIFYAKLADGFVLSSSLSEIYGCPKISKSLTKQNVLDLISVQNRIPHQVSQDAFILMPASYLKISAAGCFEQNRPVSTEESVYNLLPKNSAVKQELFIDESTIYYGLESSVSACGFPILSESDYLLPIAIKQVKCSKDTSVYTSPDTLFPYKNYISTLFRNDAFYHSIEENLSEHTPDMGTIPFYTALISDYFNIPLFSSDQYNKEETLTFFANPCHLKAALRHILLDIISKEHAPIIAFFKRSALLRLCEGGFTFSPCHSECELTAYLIKLNLWFEKYSPRIV